MAQTEPGCGVSDLFRLYGQDELGADGYPPIWHQTLKHTVREQAGDRCVRCGHPYKRGENPLVAETDDEGRTVWASWSPCDEQCTHNGPLRIWSEFGDAVPPAYVAGEINIAAEIDGGFNVDARWRILTVHHLDMVKANCRWWNLVALCQRCHLEIQWKVKIERLWLHEHSDWFKPYVAGYYAHAYLAEELDREQVEARLEELLALEHRQLELLNAGRTRAEVSTPDKETQS